MQKRSTSQVTSINHGETLAGESKEKTGLSERDKATEERFVDLCPAESCSAICICTSGSESQSDLGANAFASGTSETPAHDLSWSNTDESENDDPNFGRDGSPCPAVASSSAIALIVVDEKRKLEVHTSDPEYQHLPGAQVL